MAEDHGNQGPEQGQDQKQPQAQGERHWAENRLSEVSGERNSLREENASLQTALAERDAHISRMEAKMDQILAAQEQSPSAHGAYASGQSQQPQRRPAPDPNEDPEGYNQWWVETYIEPTIDRVVSRRFQEEVGPVTENNARQEYWSQYPSESGEVIKAVEGAIQQYRQQGNRKVSRSEVHDLVLGRIAKQQRYGGGGTPRQPATQPATAPQPNPNGVAGVAQGSTPPAQPPSQQEEDPTKLSLEERTRRLAQKGAFNDLIGR